MSPVEQTTLTQALFWHIWSLHCVSTVHALFWQTSTALFSQRFAPSLHVRSTQAPALQISVSVLHAFSIQALFWQTRFVPSSLQSTLPSSQTSCSHVALSPRTTHSSSPQSWRTSALLRHWTLTLPSHVSFVVGSHVVVSMHCAPKQALPVSHFSFSTKAPPLHTTTADKSSLHFS